MILIYIDMCIDTESLSLSLCSICILPDSKFLFDQQLTIINYKTLLPETSHGCHSTQRSAICVEVSQHPMLM